MPAPRIRPPAFCADKIKRLASHGYEMLGIANEFNVHISMLESWIKADEKLAYAYKVGKEIERQQLHAIVMLAAEANLSINGNARFLLRSKHGYTEEDFSKTGANVNLTVQPVMVVRDHGSDEEWAKKAAAQQLALTQPDSEQIESSHERAPEAAQRPSVSLVEEMPIYTSQAAPVTSAPCWYGPPVYDGQTNMPPAPISAPCWHKRA
jgi:hypothetical protein